ncbi:MAG: hypothetical protein ACRDV4_04015, partial [Acidimicrobiales bacterium]
MPLFHEDPSQGAPRVVVSGSIAVELDWALAAALRPEFRRDHAVLARIYDEAPELAERVRAFWGPDEATSCGGSIELMVLAHHGGLLHSVDPEQLLGSLEDLCAMAPTDLRLDSETPEDRRALLGRLQRLRSSKKVRASYAQLVRDVWSAVSSDWERDGLRVVKAAVAESVELDLRGASWREVARPKCLAEGTLNMLVESLGSEGVIAVVPAFFAHLGSLVDLPGTVLI